jgi:hypothetical protein
MKITKRQRRTEIYANKYEPVGGFYIGQLVYVKSTLKNTKYIGIILSESTFINNKATNNYIVFYDNRIQSINKHFIKAI